MGSRVRSEEEAGVAGGDDFPKGGAVGGFFGDGFAEVEGLGGDRVDGQDEVVGGDGASDGVGEGFYLRPL